MNGCIAHLSALCEVGLAPQYSNFQSYKTTEQHQATAAKAQLTSIGKCTLTEEHQTEVFKTTKNAI